MRDRAKTSRGSRDRTNACQCVPSSIWLIASSLDGPVEAAGSGRPRTGPLLVLWGWSADRRDGDGGQVIVDAGWRSDPFSFDRLGAVNRLRLTGDDFFAGKDVCSILLEMSNSALESER